MYRSWQIATFTRRQMYSRWAQRANKNQTQFATVEIQQKESNQVINKRIHTMIIISVQFPFRHPANGNHSQLLPSHTPINASYLHRLLSNDPQIQTYWHWRGIPGIILAGMLIVVIENEEQPYSLYIFYWNYIEFPKLVLDCLCVCIWSSSSYKRHGRSENNTVERNVYTYAVDVFFSLSLHG